MEWVYVQKMAKIAGIEIYGMFIWNENMELEFASK